MGKFSLEPYSVRSQVPGEHKPNWVTVGASLQGQGHVRGAVPCQDCFSVLSLDHSWLLMVSSDGAGSAAHSQRGSALLCTDIAPRVFTELVDKGELDLSKGLPSADEWSRICLVAFKGMRQELSTLAESEGLAPSDFNATLSIALFSVSGLLIGHIGDGRGAYLNEEGQWLASMRPHKGDEPNQTLFLNSQWDAVELTPNGVPVPEFVVHAGPIRAVSLLTDGMEKHSFECSVMDAMSSQWSDPNLPFQRFFSPLRSVLLNGHGEQDELNEAWNRFIAEGTPGLKQEHDDKTIVLACLLDEQHS